MHCMPQGATLTPFRAPIPAVSHFYSFDFRPEIVSENLENLSKIFKTSITDAWFFTKKVVPLTHAVYKK